MLRPIARAFSTNCLNERWGRAIFEASLIGLIRKDAKAVAKLDVILNDGAVGLIAMAQNQSLAQFYSHIGALADSQGYKAAHQFVRKATTSYIIPTEGHLPNELPGPETPISGTPISGTPTSESLNSAIRFDSKEMNLFDSETWLRESPIAQQKWKED